MTRRRSRASSPSGSPSTTTSSTPAQAHTAEAALAALPDARADVILLDTLGRPGDDALLLAVREVAPQAKVIVYSGYVRLMQEGALGHEADAYLEKGDDEGPLLDAIRAVVAAHLELGWVGGP